MPPPSRAERSRCEPPVRRVAIDPDSRARLEPKAADARLLDAADRVEISGPTPAVAPPGRGRSGARAPSHPRRAGRGGVRGDPRLVGRAAHVAVAGLDRCRCTRAGGRRHPRGSSPHRTWRRQVAGAVPRRCRGRRRGTPAPRRARARGPNRRPCRTRRSSRRRWFRCIPAACSSWSRPLDSGRGRGVAGSGGARRRSGRRVDVGLERRAECTGPSDRQRLWRRASRRGDPAARRCRPRVSADTVADAAIAPTAPTRPTTSSRSASPAAYGSWARSSARDTRSSWLAVFRQLGRGLRHRSQRAHVGDGEVRSGRDGVEAGALEGADRGGARVELLDLLLRAQSAARGGGALGRRDDEVAFEHGDLDLERTDHAADVGAAAGPREQVADAPVETRELVGWLVPLGTHGHERQLVSAAFDPRADQRDPLRGLGGARRQGRAGLERARQGVEQPARLRQAHRERPARRQRRGARSCSSRDGRG